MSQENKTDIWISNVNPTVKEELVNISKNEGIPLSSLLKQKLREITASYPPNMKIKKD